MIFFLSVCFRCWFHATYPFISIIFLRLIRYFVWSVVVGDWAFCSCYLKCLIRSDFSISKNAFLLRILITSVVGIDKKQEISLVGCYLDMVKIKLFWNAFFALAHKATATTMLILLLAITLFNMTKLCHCTPTFDLTVCTGVILMFITNCLPVYKTLHLRAPFHCLCETFCGFR